LYRNGLSFAKKEIEKQLTAEGVTASLLPVAMQGKANILAEIESGIDRGREQISREWGNSIRIDDLSVLNLENVPFAASRAKVTPESLKQAEKEFFTTILRTPFEIELYQRLETLKNQLNGTLTLAR